MAMNSFAHSKKYSVVNQNYMETERETGKKSAAPILFLNTLDVHTDLYSQQDHELTNFKAQKVKSYIKERKQSLKKVEKAVKERQPLRPISVFKNRMFEKTNTFDNRVKVNYDNQKLAGMTFGRKMSK
jgi:hypothetical protein